MPVPSWGERTGVLWVVGALSAVLGAHRLGAKSFWHDEAFTAAMVTLPLDRFAEVTTGRELNQMPYYLALRPWASVFGTGEVALRSLSVVGAATAAVLVVILGRRLVGAQAALTGGLLLVINPFFVAYAQEARSYAVAVAAVAGAGILLCRALERPATSRLAAYALVGGLSAYVHMFAGLAVAAQALAVVFARLPWRRVAPAWTAIAIAGLPLIAFLAKVDTDDADTFPQVTLSTIGDVLESSAGGTTLLVALTSLAAVAVLLGPHRSGERVLAVWLVLPLVAAWAWSVSVQPMFVDRFMIVVLPALMLLAGAGLDRLPRTAGGVVLVSLLAVSASGLVDWYGREKQKDWRAASAMVVDRWQEGDAIVFVRPHVRPTFTYYDRQGVVPPTAILLPAATWELGDLKSEVPPLDGEAVIAAAPNHPRVWAFLTHQPGPGLRGTEVQVVMDAVETRYRRVTERTFNGLVVALYERMPGEDFR